MKSCDVSPSQVPLEIVSPASVVTPTEILRCAGGRMPRICFRSALKHYSGKLRYGTLIVGVRSGIDVDGVLLLIDYGHNMRIVKDNRDCYMLRESVS